MNGLKFYPNIGEVSMLDLIYVYRLFELAEPINDICFLDCKPGGRILEVREVIVFKSAYDLVFFLL